MNDGKMFSANKWFHPFSREQFVKEVKYNFVDSSPYFFLVALSFH